MTNGSLLNVESIAECSPASSDNWSWKPIFGLFESRCFTQVVLYYKQYGGGGCVMVTGSLEAVWSGLIDWFDSLRPINNLSVI